MEQLFYRVGSVRLPVALATWWRKISVSALIGETSWNEKDSEKRNFNLHDAKSNSLMELSKRLLLGLREALDSSAVKWDLLSLREMQKHPSSFIPKHATKKKTQDG